MTLSERTKNANRLELVYAILKMEDFEYCYDKTDNRVYFNGQLSLCNMIALDPHVYILVNTSAEYKHYGWCIRFR